MDLSFSKFGAVKDHNLSLSRGSKTGRIKKSSEIIEHYNKTIPDFVQYMIGMRNDNLKNDEGQKVKGHYVSFRQALNLCYGIEVPEKVLRQGEVASSYYAINAFLRPFGLSTESSSFSSIAMKFMDVSEFNEHDAGKAMIDSRASTSYAAYAESIGNFNSNHSSTAGTAGVPNDFRFLISEMILDIIQVGYQHVARYPNWIANEITVTNRNKITMPQIRTGDTMMHHVAEGADVPYGSIQFGKKDVKISKHGVGVKLTDELIRESSIDLASEFLSQVGNDIRIALDTEALFCLVNGEQGDGSEAAAVVGVTNPANGFTYRDTKKVFTRLDSLGFPANRMIANEDTGIDITEIEEYKGYEGNRVFSNVDSGIIGVPERFAIDTQVLPENQIMYVSSPNAMIKLNAGGMMVEQDRNIQNQTNRVIVTDTSGFAKLRKDAAIIQDKSVTGIDFPASMDIYSRMAETYKSLCD